MARAQTTYPPSQHKVADSDFALDDPATGISTPDLAGEIHPLFSRHMFRGISNGLYAALRLPLILATRMLQDDRAIYYLVTTAEGSLHILDDEDQSGPEISPSLLSTNTLYNDRLVRCSRAVPKPNAPWTCVDDAMRARARQILRDLHWTLNEITIAPPHAVGDHTTVGTAGSLPEGRAFFPAAPDHQLEIVIEHATTYNFTICVENSPIALAYHAQLARTLVHEIGHVLTVATHGERALGGTNVFLEHCCCNEPGFNLETLLFGGICEMRDMNNFFNDGRVDPQVVLEEYPNQATLDLYTTIGIPIGQRWLLDRYCKFTRIPWAFTTSMFTERFWRQDAPCMTGPIQPAVRSSWIFIRLRAGERIVTESGRVAQANYGITMPCSAADPTLPERVQTELRDIVARQQPRG